MARETEKSNLYSKIASLLQAARQNVVRAVNQTMVYNLYIFSKPKQYGVTFVYEITDRRIKTGRFPFCVFPSY